MGCSNSDSKFPSQTSQLESQVANTSNELAQLRSDLSGLTNAILQVQRHWESNLNELWTQVGAQNERVHNSLMAIADWTNSFKPPKVVYVPTTPASSKASTLSNGVPVSIYNEILRTAKAKYPTDFDMQEFVVRQQIEAYLKLHPR